MSRDWVVEYDEAGNEHVLPVDDICVHDRSFACACGPFIRADGRVVHHSLDGRELGGEA